MVHCRKSDYDISDLRSHLIRNSINFSCRGAAELRRDWLLYNGMAGIWDNWKEPASGGWVPTFAIITTDSNEPVAEIHERMPVYRVIMPASLATSLTRLI